MALILRSPRLSTVARVFGFSPMRLRRSVILSVPAIGYAFVLISSVELYEASIAGGKISSARLPRALAT